MTDVLPVSLPPEEAVEHFRAKGFEISFAWQDVYAEQHARAFTVAKVARLDVLTDLRDAVDRAIAEGTSFSEFRRQLEPTLRERGWWGVGRMVDPADGVEKEVQLGSPRRLRTIYDTNLRTSLAAGQWQRIERTKARRPYLRYTAILDDATRPAHRGWQGTILPADHPWWRTHFPPNGWLCRCGVQQLSERDLARYGYQVSNAPAEGPVRTYVNPRTGDVRQVPAGIDPGFDYHVGDAHESRRQVARVLADRVAAAPAEIGAAAWQDAGKDVREDLAVAFMNWADALPRSGPVQRFPVGALSPRVVARLTDLQRPPRTAGVTISSQVVRRADKADPYHSLALPVVLSEPAAVLLDLESNLLLYLRALVGADHLRVVRVRPAGSRDRLPAQVVDVALVERRELADASRYEVVEGSLPKPGARDR